VQSVKRCHKLSVHGILDQKNIILEWCNQFEDIVWILHCLMHDLWVQKNFSHLVNLAQVNLCGPIAESSTENAAFWYCSLCTTKEKLVAHCASFVVQKQLSPEY